MFKENRKRIEDEKCPGWPSASADEQQASQIKEVIFADNVDILKGSFGQYFGP